MKSACASSAALLLVVFASMTLMAAAAPKPTPKAKCSSVAQLLKKTKNLSTMTKFTKAVPYIQTTLSNSSWVGTVFMPSDAAIKSFAKANNVTTAQMIGNMDILAMVIQNHLVAGLKLSAKLLKKQKKPLSTFLYQNITVSYKSGKVSLKPAGGVAARISKFDLAACKAYVHIIDKVLIPQGF